MILTAISGMFGGVNDFYDRPWCFKETKSFFEMIRQSDNFQEYDTMNAMCNYEKLQ